MCMITVRWRWPAWNGYKIFVFLRELPLVESLDGLCERMLEYRIHKERTDSTRFDKSMSQTFKTLHGLV